MRTIPVNNKANNYEVDLSDLQVVGNGNGYYFLRGEIAITNMNNGKRAVISGEHDTDDYIEEYGFKIDITEEV